MRKRILVLVCILLFVEWFDILNISEYVVKNIFPSFTISNFIQEKSVNKELNDQRQYKIVPKTFAEGNVHIKYPQVEGIDNHKIEESINNLIKDDLFKNEIESGDIIKYLQDSNLHGIEDSLVLELEYKIMMQTNELLSILYTGKGAFETSAFWTFDVYAITIDIENATKLKLSDFVKVDEVLIQQMKQSTNVYNGAITDGMSKDELLAIIKIEFDNEYTKFGDYKHMLDVLSKGVFCVTPNSLVLSMSLGHASGDYALVEIPYEHTKYK